MASITQQPKSILKKPKHQHHAGPSNRLQSSSHKPGPSTSTSTSQTSQTAQTSNTTKNRSSKSKHTVSLKVKGERLRGPDLESESEGNVSGFEGGVDDDEDENDEFELAGDDVDVEMKELGEDEDDTGDEIEGMKDRPRSKKNTKRKRPPTTASIFGDTLTSLLSDPLVKPSKTRSTGANAVHVTPKSQSQLTTTISQPTKKQKPTPPTTGSTKNPNQKAQNEDKKENQKPKTIRNPILALSTRRLPPSQASISLEAKAARLLKLEKEEKEDRARVRDVLTGWTPAEPVPGAVGADGKEIVQVGSQEFERGLKKVAQRGVIKLFNAILVASKNAEHETETSLAQAKLKPDLPKNKREKDNVLGRGGKKEEVLTKESFLDLVRKGGSK